MFQQVKACCEDEACHRTRLDEPGLQRRLERNRLEAGEVDVASRRNIFGVQGKRVNIDRNIRDVCVGLPRLNQAVVRRLASLLTNRRVELDLERPEGVFAQQAGVVEPVVRRLLAFAPEHDNQLDDGVRQREEHLVEVAHEALVLVLLDERVERGRGKLVTLGDIQVDVAQVNVGLQVAGLDGLACGAVEHHKPLVRHDDAVDKFLEADRNFNACEQRRNRRECLAGCLCEEERQGAVQVSLLLRVVYEVFTRIALANHLRQALPRLTREFLPDEQHIRVKYVDDLAANYNRRLLCEQLPNRVRPVGPHTGVLAALRHTHVPAKLVARVVHFEHVIVNATLDPFRVSVPRRRIRQEQRLVCRRARQVAITRDGERHRRRAATGHGGVARADAGQLIHDIGEVKEICGLSNTCSGI